MIIDPADLIAFRRAADTIGRDAAMLELRRRYLGLTDQNAPAILDRLLVLPVTPPPPHVVTNRGVTHPPISIRLQAIAPAEGHE